MRVLRLFLSYLITVSFLTAEVNLGPAGAVAVGFDSSIRHTSNVFLNSSEESDLIYTLLPSINYRSNQGAVGIDAFMGVEMVRFSDFNSIDDNNFKCGFSAIYPMEKNGENISLTFSGSYEESNEAREALLNIVNVDTLSLSLIGSYYLGDILSMRSSILYENHNTDTDTYVDVESIELPLAFYYDYDEAMSFGLGYSFRKSDVSRLTVPADSEDHAFFIGFEDLLSPLIQYEAKLGYRYRDFKYDTNFDDGGGIYAKLKLRYNLSEITQLSLMLSSDFRTSAANQSVNTSSARFTLNHRLDPMLTADMGFIISSDNYEQILGTRDDDDWGVSLGLNYELSEINCVLKGSISFLKNSSDLDSANYNLIVANFVCSFLY
ncbi:MAG: outer membrane beta-barrel protein [Verrucomicrobiota bacterium]|nr:outer membrane beta-barrel protein [Verrucomicrobiota bacterium]